MPLYGVPSGSDSSTAPWNQADAPAPQARHFEAARELIAPLINWNPDSTADEIFAALDWIAEYTPDKLIDELYDRFSDPDDLPDGVASPIELFSAELREKLAPCIDDFVRIQAEELAANETE